MELQERQLYLLRVYYIYSISGQHDHGLMFKVYISGVLKLPAAWGANVLHAATKLCAFGILG